MGASGSAPMPGPRMCKTDPRAISNRPGLKTAARVTGSAIKAGDVLVASALISVLSLARLFKYLLAHHEVPTMAFFFGLILLSVWYVGTTVRRSLDGGRSWHEVEAPGDGWVQASGESLLAMGFRSARVRWSCCRWPSPCCLSSILFPLIEVLVVVFQFA